MNLTDRLAATHTLLVDFDGPICSVFAGYPARQIAERMGALVRKRLGADAPAALPTDPLEVLAWVGDLGDDDLSLEISDANRDAEVAAVASATPTPGAADVLRSAHETGRRVAIVSNNAPKAIESYLTRTALSQYVDRVVGRSDAIHPDLLKPAPFLVEQALRMTETQAGETVFVGDAITDIQAGRAAGVPTIGYANKPGKSERLSEAGADFIIVSMQQLAAAVRSVAARPAR